MQDGASRIVLDNTYVTRKSRAEVIQAARDLGVPVRCLHLTTSLDDAQVNAVTRLIERYGHLPDERELKVLRKTDVAAFGPSVLFRYQRDLEPPDPSEGFVEHRAGAVHARAQPRAREPRGDRLVRRPVRARTPHADAAPAPGRRLDDLRAVVAARDRGRDAHRGGSTCSVRRRR